MAQKLLFKDVVSNIFTEVPKNPKSHVRGWAMHWAETLGGVDGVGVLSKDDSFDGVDTLYFDHGVNTEIGTMNLFGGVSDQVVDRLEQIADNPSLSIVSLDGQMPVKAYVDGLYKRVGQASTSPRLTKSLIREFESRLMKNVNNFVEQADFVTGSVCIGDSHSTAYAEKGQPVIRRNGLTLHSALKKDGFFRTTLGSLPETIEKVTLVAGSIDIRHHIGLKNDPMTAAVDLAHGLIDLTSEYDFAFELAIPVPVETEDRRVPKTGWLNGRPFTGSREDRLDWTLEFEDTLIVDYNGPLIRPPWSWYEMDPEQYAKEVMELASSFHIAPTHYRRYGGWRGDE